MAASIRLATTADAPAIRDIYAPSIVNSITSFEIEVPSVAEMEKRIRDVIERHAWLVFERDRRVLGYAYASLHRARPAYQWSAETSVYVHAEAHRRGVGRALYTALFEIVRQQGYTNALAGITLPNPSSERLHESFGFKRVGTYHRVGFKLGAWHDVSWFELKLGDTAGPLTPAPAVLARDSVAALLVEQAGRVR